MKTFEAVFNENNKGVYSISLVNKPAMEGNFIALSKDAKVEFKTVDEEQRILMGLVLEPNKPIYRNQDGEEFNIVFSEETIKDLSQNFFKQGYQTNSSIEHSGNRVEGLSFFESWIVEDSKVDKSANFGLSYPKGSWVATMKVDNEDVWNEYVKTGEVLGFSIDAFVTLKEVNLKSNIEMAEEKKDNFQDLKVWFTENILNNKPEIKLTKVELSNLSIEEIDELIKLGAIKSEDGAVVIMYDGEVPEVGASVWVEGEDGSKIPLPVGEIPLEGGQVLVISEDGIIGEIKEMVQDEVKPNAEEDLAKPEVPNQATVDAIKSVLIKYKELDDAKFAKFETKLSEIVKENEALKSEVVTLSEQPASKAIKSIPEQKVALTKKGRILEAMRNNKN